MNKCLISIVGPTAIGKTSLGLQIAKHFNTEIISADSRQFYKEMSIGTAVPSPSELKKVKHHFIQNISIYDDYDVGSFEKDALNKLEQLFQQYKILVMVGGSGLYVDAVVKGLNDFPKIEAAVRERLNDQLVKDGIEVLQEKLKKLDRETFQKMDIQNPHRIIRALEVSISSGNPYSFYLNRPKAMRPFKVVSIGLTAKREIIYKRIDQRVDQMINDGLIEEVKKLSKAQYLNALNTVGYKEIFKYLDKELSLEEAISEIKKNTRRFAKRQMTWFKKDASINWYDYKTDPEEIIKDIENKLQKNEKV